MTKAVFFDFDGTLADTAPGIVLTMQKAFEAMGLPAPADEAVRQTIGMPLLESVRTLGRFDHQQAEQGTEIYRQLFPVYEVGHVRLFPQVPETLEALHRQGLRLAIVTSRTGTSFEVLMQRFGLGHYFEAKVTSLDGLPPKPAPDMTLALLERMQLQADEAVVVGDTTFDILMGNAAGCRTIGVTYGNHSRERLLTAQPSALAEGFEEIPDIISQHETY